MERAEMVRKLRQGNKIIRFPKEGIKRQKIRWTPTQLSLRKLNVSVETNMGPIPGGDLLDILARQYGYDSYLKLYDTGCRIRGYEHVTPKIIRLWETRADWRKLIS